MRLVQRLLLQNLEAKLKETKVQSINGAMLGIH
jgi:hypothetical protein